MEDNFETEISDNAEIVSENSDVLETAENVSENESEIVEKEEYKPWKKKPDHVPYNRFSEVITEKNKLKEDYERLQKEIESYKNVSEKVKTIDNIEDLDITQFEDIKDYQKALANVIKKEFERENERKEYERNIVEAENKILSTFNQSIERAAKSNPEIKEAVEYLGQYSNHIRPEIRYALLTDEYGPEVIYEIATTPGLLQEIVTMNPLDAARKITKISTKYERQSSENVENNMSNNIPKSMPKPTPKVASTPNVTTKNGGKGFGRYSDDIPLSEYRKLKAQGKI